jgi:CRP-like cAMP-binding protein
VTNERVNIMTATIELFRNADYCIDFPAGHTIFEKGQSGDVMYVVIAGHVNVLIHDTIINSIGPGGILGDGVDRHGTTKRHGCG